MKKGSLIRGDAECALLWSGWFDMKDVVIGKLLKNEFAIVLDSTIKKFDERSHKGIKIHTAEGIVGWCSSFDVKKIT